jgi:hypothetical protein
MPVASLTNRCKTVTVSGNAAFAIVRGLRDRITRLTRRETALKNDPTGAGLEMLAYYSDQLRAAHDALRAMESAKVEG